MSVLTTTEGENLHSMAQGLVKRYSAAQEEPPVLVYVDRDCCSGTNRPKLKEMFEPWDPVVCLDIWHFMRRFALGCSTDAHPLYGTFMSRLSSCIFVWDNADLQQLRLAKRAELSQQGIVPNDKLVEEEISKREMSLYCRRRTRGEEETKNLIKQLLTDMLPLTDACGVPLFDREKMKAIWQVQKRHVSCIQDPTDVNLYKKVRTQSKGGVPLNVYRCGRGSTSLESFHLHLNRFIPGMSFFNAIMNWQQLL